jgi:hypothetical protein
MKRILPLAFVALLGWSPAVWAQDKPFSMVGTWLLKGDGISVGESIHPEHNHGVAEPNVIAVNLRWVVDKQSGTTFSGSAIGPSGTKERLIGSLSKDGKRGVIVNARGGITDIVMIDANTLESCHAVRTDKQLAAACLTVTRQ